MGFVGAVSGMQYYLPPGAQAMMAGPPGSEAMMRPGIDPNMMYNGAQVLSPLLSLFGTPLIIIFPRHPPRLELCVPTRSRLLQSDSGLRVAWQCSTWQPVCRSSGLSMFLSTCSLHPNRSEFTSQEQARPMGGLMMGGREGK